MPTTPNPYKKELDTAVEIAREASKIMLEYFDGDQQKKTKEDATVVTIADTLINSLVIKRLAEAFPNDGVVGEEESTAQYGMGRRWVCDPIDGTVSYTWGLPTAMFSLALVVDGTPVMGVCYDPFLDKMYTGYVGGPSLCNGKMLAVSDLTLSEGVVGVTGSVSKLLKSAHVPLLIKNKIKTAAYGGYVHKASRVAVGKFVAHIEYGASAHDVAAIHVIIEGAGGKVSSPSGEKLSYLKPFKGVIVSNGKVHDEIVRYCSVQ